MYPTNAIRVPIVIDSPIDLTPIKYTNATVNTDVFSIAGQSNN